MNRPTESDYVSHVAYTRALEEYCNKVEPTSADYALGFAEGFNEGCRPRPWQSLTEFQFAEIYNKWNDTNGSTPWGLNQALEAKLRKLNK